MFEKVCELRNKIHLLTPLIQSEVDEQSKMDYNIDESFFNSLHERFMFNYQENFGLFKEIEEGKLFSNDFKMISDATSSLLVPSTQFEKFNEIIKSVKGNCPKLQDRFLNTLFIIILRFYYDLIFLRSYDLSEILAHNKTV